jgi:hypothetical protein
MNRVHRVGFALFLLSTQVPSIACGDDPGRAEADTGIFTTGLATEGAGTDDQTSSADSAGATEGSDHDDGTTHGDTDPDGGSTETGDGDDGPPVCPAGTIVCEGDTAQVCDGMGGFESEESCETACAPDLGCVACVPGTSRCSDGHSETCLADGSGYGEPIECDPLQGMDCDEQGNGLCTGPCAPQQLGESYIGCDYYPASLLQNSGYQGGSNAFRVAVANTGAADAEITVTRQGNVVATAVVAPGAVETVTLPWVTAISITNTTVNASQAAYRLRSTQPVTVYQYNPYHATVSNDASLLMPTNTWRSEFVSVAWPHWVFSGSSHYRGFLAVVAAHDDTTVTLTGTPSTTNISAAAGIDANGSGTVDLSAGDVLQVVTNGAGGDTTGIRVESNKPVEVFGGHECTNVPLHITACDHLEESVFGVEQLGQHYLVAPPVRVPHAPALKEQIVRIVAVENDTNLTYDPDFGAPTNIASAGEWIELPMSTQAFELKSDKKVLVAQYMVGQSADNGLADPAMVLAVPVDQYRSDYLVHAAPSWTQNWADIVAPDGVDVEINGVAVTTWTPIGGSGYSVGRAQLSNAGDGNHTIVASQPVGIGIYGVQNYGSYWYPGGLDLQTITPQ